MKTFTHEQVQEILRSAGEAPDDDRAGIGRTPFRVRRLPVVCRPGY